MSGMSFCRTESAALLFGVTVAALAAMLITRWQQRSRRNDRVPSKWRRVGEISEVWLYPLKSGRAISLLEGDCTDIGMQTTEDHPMQLRDRFLMVYIERTGTMVTARQHPKLVLIDVTSGDDKFLTFAAPDMPDLKVKLPTGKEIKIGKMWMNEEVGMLDCGDEVAEWLCQYLLKEKSGLRLAYYRIETVQRRDLSMKPWTAYQKHFKSIQSGDSGAYSDMTSFMLMNESSVDDIRQRLSPRLAKLSSRWFRPNLVVRGAAPFAEDAWDWLRIGEDAIFRSVKPCTRCIMTTVDPETGIKDSSMEPVRTLKTYRQLTDPEAKKLEGDAPVLGMHMGLRRAGRVHVGAAVYVGEQ